MLKTYYKSTSVYFNDISVCYLSKLNIFEESEINNSETVYTGYDDIKAHINDIPCMIFYDTNKKTKEVCISIRVKDSLKYYTINKTSEATIKVIVNYRETQPSFKDMFDIKADKVFQYMMQFLPTERGDTNENSEIS